MQLPGLHFLLQLKADAVDGLDVVGVGIDGFELFADVGNVDVDGVVLAGLDQCYLSVYTHHRRHLRMAAGNGYFECKAY